MASNLQDLFWGTAWVSDRAEFSCDDFHGEFQKSPSDLLFWLPMTSTRTQMSHGGWHAHHQHTSRASAFRGCLSRVTGLGSVGAAPPLRLWATTSGRSGQRSSGSRADVSPLREETRVSIEPKKILRNPSAGDSALPFSPQCRPTGCLTTTAQN